MYASWGSLKSVSGNYTFTTQTNTMTITTASQTLTVQPYSQSVKQATCLSTGIPALTYKMTGFLGWDNQSTTTTGAPVLSVPSYNNDCAKGTYTIQSAAGTLQLNSYGGQTDYSGINYGTATLTIN
jgi:hypothetical protein